jgi:hypothetical protein
MAKFSEALLQGLMRPAFGEQLAQAGRGLVQTPMLMRQEEQRKQREKGMMGGMLAAQQAAAEGRFDPETMKAYMGSMQGLGVPPQDIMQTLPTLQQANQASVVNNKQNQLVGLQQQLNEQAQILLESDDRSRKEAANFQIDSIEEQMVNIGKETRGIDAGTFVGVGDKTRAGVTKTQLNQLEIDAKRRGAQEQMATSSLQQLKFGTKEWNKRATELEQLGFRRAVQRVRQSEQEIQIANQEYQEAMQNSKEVTPAQIKKMEADGITVPKDALGQRQAWRSYSKEKLEKQIAAATSSLDPVSAARAEGLVKWTLQGIAERGDFIDTFADDITSVIEDLTPEQHSEINSLVNGQTETDVGPVVEQWLRRNYPEPFEKSEKFRQNKQRQADAREQAIADVFAANDNLDPNDPVDVRLVNQRLDASIRESQEGEIAGRKLSRVLGG